MKQNYSPQRRRKWWLFTSALVKSVNYICILVPSYDLSEERRIEDVAFFIFAFFAM